MLPTCANFSASLIYVAEVALLGAVAGADAVAEALPVALLDELPEALSPVTFEAVSQAAKRNATAKRARSL